MRLVLECPPSLLKDVQPLGDFDLVLAHLVLEDREYAEFYKDSSRFCVLDNGVNEIGKPCSVTDILMAERIIIPDLIVPPDYLGDAEMTIAALDAMLHYFGRSRILPVVQGSNLFECLGCLESIRDRGFERVAVPYRVTCGRDASRVEMAAARQVVVEFASEMFSSIHLFGMSTLEELTYYKNLHVESIDTGAPVMCGLNGIMFGRDKLPEKLIPTLHSVSGDNWECVLHNISYLRELIG